MKETRIISIKFEVYSSLNDLPNDEQDLLASARGALDNTHSIYSRFKVGAAIQLKNGDIIPGSNQENAAYGSTICAERAALMSLGSSGNKTEMQKLAVIGTGDDIETTSPVTPCGSCRQVIREYQDLSGEPTVILAAGSKGDIWRFPDGIDSLLPLGFGPKDLGLTL
ncbi:MAG: cytidine deaminase [Candidatus Levyibacteriota bacterium]